MIRHAIAALAVMVQVLLPIVIVGTASAEKWVGACSPNGTYLVSISDGPRATSLYHCAACPICPVQFAVDGGQGLPSEFTFVGPDRLSVAISQRVYVRPPSASQTARSPLQPRGPPLVS